MVCFESGRGFRSQYQNGCIRSAPAVTDCHYALSDRWSCGESEIGGGATASASGLCISQKMCTMRGPPPHTGKNEQSVTAGVLLINPFWYRDLKPCPLSKQTIDQSVTFTCQGLKGQQCRLERTQPDLLYLATNKRLRWPARLKWLVTSMKMYSACFYFSLSDSVFSLSIIRDRTQEPQLTEWRNLT